MADDGITRAFGGSPLSVLVRLIMVSILVGVILAALGLDPWNILRSLQHLGHLPAEGFAHCGIKVDGGFGDAHGFSQEGPFQNRSGASG